MIFGCTKVPTVGNSVVVRRSNNHWTGDDPILVGGVLRQSKIKWPSMDFVHLPLLWLATSWASLQHFLSCHSIVHSVVRTFVGQNARQMEIF